MVIVHELGVNDILLGRGTGPNENQGNIRFRRHLEEIVEKYLKSPVISKTKLASEVLQTIKERNGHFVRKLTSEERRSLLGRFWNVKNKNGRENDEFVVVADKLAVEKIRQSFRFQLNNNNSKSKKRRTSVFADTQTMRSRSQHKPKKTRDISPVGVERPMDATSSSSLLLHDTSPPFNKEALGGGSQTPRTLGYHNYLLNAARRPNNIATNPQNLQQSLLLQSLQRQATPQLSLMLQSNDAFNSMLLDLRMSRMSNTNLLPLHQSSAARRLDDIDKTISLLFPRGGGR
jgi:hypothetical protein